MKNRKIYIIGTFALAFLGSVSLLGCATSMSASYSTEPMTDNIVAKVGGAENIPNFQYYLSKTITLQKEQRSSETAVSEGVGKVRNTVERDIIQITGSTAGVVIKQEWIVNRWEISVAFEDNDDNFLVFGKWTTSPEENYKLLFQDLANWRVTYGGEYYVVNWDATRTGTDAPYLLIKMDAKEVEKTNTRTVTGRTLQQK